MWSRWDMQDHPPDILITNYSMLNIMLMRGVESAIFDQTRQWLSSDTSHVFHLVVDELHTYSGTPGTEVAYLIRVLLDRLGLAPDSTQLRIIASSASVASGAAGEQYLESFFGRDRARFQIVSGTPQPLDPNAFAAVQANATALQQLRDDVRDNGGIATMPIALTLQNAVGAPPVPAASAEQVVESGLAHIGAPALYASPAHRGHSIHRSLNRDFPSRSPQECFRHSPLHKDCRRSRVCSLAYPLPVERWEAPRCQCERISSTATCKASGCARIPDAPKLRLEPRQFPAGRSTTFRR